MKPEIKQLAWDCGAVPVMSKNEFKGSIIFGSDFMLERFADAILELAAKECEQVAWTNKSTPLLGPELNSTKCAQAIRALKAEVGK